MVEVVRGRTRERCSTESCGSWVRGRSGASYPRNIRRTRPATAASAVGKGRKAGTYLACSVGGVAGPREAATRGGLYRRLLHGGKKGGLAVGPTKRGKGTKIIAL